ncbi:MAG: hypothetical protein AMS25_13340 [Gemmatimonas sp. SM23_52]|nr:MAG: hypothetical protein AMS25_13340 [Gemmatimonas sp. SM23_52]
MEAPRVLIVSPEQWPRALLRAELLEAGYDAVGSRTLSAALRYPRTEAGRGPVGLIIVDQAVVEREAPDVLERLASKHAGSRCFLLARSSGALPAGNWDAVLRRPQSIRQIVEAVRRVLSIRYGSSESD